MSNVSKKIIEMLKENTRRHMLDSGGAYGRHYQRNQDIEFEKEPYLNIELNEDCDIDITKSVYHFLTKHLDINDMTDMLNSEHNEMFKDSDESYMCDIDEFLEHIVDKYEATGLYGRDKPFIENTYNGDCILSQTLQYGYFEIDEQPYIILQIHGGCDVRGGYTKPYIFAIDETFLMYNDASIHFKDGTYIYTDDGFKWYSDDINGDIEISKTEGQPDINPKKITIEHDGIKEIKKLI